MMSIIERVCLVLRAAISAVVVALFSVMLVAVLVQVAGRYFLNFSIAQAAEIATFCQIWLVLLGAGVAVSRGQHVAIDILPSKLPLAGARVALVLSGGGGDGFALAPLGIAARALPDWTWLTIGKIQSDWHATAGANLQHRGWVDNPLDYLAAAWCCTTSSTTSSRTRPSKRGPTA